ncbi:rhomboid family intramembrane serine protease [Fulvivirga sp. RKSG066]|nr:rhomboid family intramembrane serine protease [Fulvivirga aurantia]
MSLTLIFVIGTSIISIYAWQNQDLTRKWIFNPYSVNKYGQYYRFITSGFLHGSWLHLIFNMLVLWMFGEQVEAIFSAIYGPVIGKVIFGALYLIGIIVSDIPTFFKHRHAAYYNALGASGGVSSILFSSILFNPNQELCLYGLLCLPGIIWGVIYIIYSFYMGRQQSDNINHDAHLYGGLFGIVFTIIAFPSVIPHFIEQLMQLKLFQAN